MICADTSFLISHYGDDVNSETARAWMAKTDVMQVHEVNDFEFDNALRLLVYRGKITPAERTLWQSAYETDKNNGAIIVQTVDMNTVFEKAESLSAAHTETGGHHAYDILHVTAALLLGATEFWSFDGKQRALALAEGLKVGP